MLPVTGEVINNVNIPGTEGREGATAVRRDPLPLHSDPRRAWPSSPCTGGLSHGLGDGCRSLGMAGTRTEARPWLLAPPSVPAADGTAFTFAAFSLFFFEMFTF